jgi:hypothetical protein
VRRFCVSGAAAAAVLTAVLALAPAVQTPAPLPYTVLSREGRRPLPVRTLSEKP